MSWMATAQDGSGRIDRRRRWRATAMAVNAPRAIADHAKRCSRVIPGSCPLKSVHSGVARPAMTKA